jgi:phenylacetate-CoA ligase
MDVALIARVLSMRGALRARQRWSVERIASHRAAQLDELRRYAYQKSPFYRRFHAGLETKPLHELPVLTKATLMENFDEVVTDRALNLADVRAHLEHLTCDELLLGKYRVVRTSGSTGSPGVFVSDPHEWASVIASYSRAQEWAGILARLTQRTRLAVVSSRVPWHQSARVGVSVDSFFVPVRRFDATDPLESTVAGLNAWQPHNLIAYASMGRILAEEQIAGRLTIAPKVVMSASEVLSPESRRRIQQAWGHEPYDVYAATETAGVASECSRHRLHLFDDLVITEVVNDSNEPVPSGEFGSKLLVTVLFSRTQPLIRYEMSDRVMLSRQPCDCGLPFALLGGIEGRAEDILQLPARGGGTISIHPNLFHDLLEPLPVQGWQVLEEPEVIRVLLAHPAATIDLAGLRLDVVRMLERQGAAARAVRIEQVEAVVKTAMGKAPLIKTSRPANT